MARWWGLDLGTTNSSLAVWSDARSEAEMVDLGDVSRQMLLTESPVVPSAVYINPKDDFWTSLGRIPSIERRWLLGRQAYIGREAGDRNYEGRQPNYVESFKPLLAAAPTKVMTRVGGRAYTAREITRIFMRELVLQARRIGREKINALTMAVPVDSFETYRAELSAAAARLGIRGFQTVDEPVAAALGYGLNTERELTMLVFDFGGSTLDVAVVRTTGPGKAGTPAEVVAKQGLSLGGNNVDVWLVEHFARQINLNANLWRGTEWYQALLDSAQALKEDLFHREEASLSIGGRMGKELGFRDQQPTLSRDGLIEVLREHGLYADIERTIETLLTEAASRGIEPRDIDEVLITGGSSLLPDVHRVLADIFGRPRLRDWLPFEAVANGACVFAAGHRVQDFIRHDYALLTFDRDSRDVEYPVIIPRGTQYPTDGPVWEGYFTPTCARGEPATEFELKICEISRATGPQKAIGYDENSRLRVLDRAKDEVVVICLNEGDATLGFLRPPHPPHRTEARLRIGFAVNNDRYLTATVSDLLTNTRLMENQPVVKLR